MTPQEKADNLVNQFRIVLMREDTDCGNEILCTRIAKDSALIAVDEILELTKKPKSNPFDCNEITGFYYDKYWKQVKQEIEKL